METDCEKLWIPAKITIFGGIGFLGRQIVLACLNLDHTGSGHVTASGAREAPLRQIQSRLVFVNSDADDDASVASAVMSSAAAIIAHQGRGWHSQAIPPHDRHRLDDPRGDWCPGADNGQEDRPIAVEGVNMACRRRGCASLIFLVLACSRAR